MIFQQNLLKDKVALISGGSKGIGEAIVWQFAKLGAKVVFTYNSNQEKASEIASAAVAQDLNVTALKLDVTDRAQCQKVVEETISLHDTIDFLINNSGIVKDGVLVGLTEEDITQVIDTNLHGVINFTQAAVPYMMRKRCGKIINMSSVASTAPGRGQSNYAASKGAINAFTKAMACELAKKNITVNAIAPGTIETDISKDVRENATDEALSKVLLKRFGQPDEVAQLTAFMCSPAADYINGQIIAIDGGFKLA